MGAVPTQGSGSFSCIMVNSHKALNITQIQLPFLSLKQVADLLGHSRLEITDGFAL